MMEMHPVRSLKHKVAHRYFWPQAADRIGSMGDGHREPGKNLVHVSHGMDGGEIRVKRWLPNQVDRYDLTVNFTFNDDDELDWLRADRRAINFNEKGVANHEILEATDEGIVVMELSPTFVLNAMRYVSKVLESLPQQ